MRTLPNFVNDTIWKILSQYHGWSDSGESGRNPTGAITAQDKTGKGGSGFNYPVKADSNVITTKDDKGRWNYTRSTSFDMEVDTPPGETITLIVESYIWLHHTHGAQKLIVNGNVIIDETAVGNYFNDQRGPTWGFGLYKYFFDDNEPFNWVRIERAQSRRVAGPR